MKLSGKFGLTLGVVGLGVLAVSVFFLAMGPKEGAKPSTTSVKAPNQQVKVRKSSLRPKERHDRKRKIDRVAHREGVKRPDFSEAAKDESVQLSQAYKELLAELQQASDSNDWRKLVAKVREMQDLEAWPDGIPSVLHKAAIDALKWFGNKCAPELAGYLASSDSEVVDEAMSGLMDMLGDTGISDFEKSDLLKSLAKAVTDKDSLDTMFMELDNMRPTVRAETALEILDSGNQSAVEVLMENLDFYFQSDGYDVTTKDALEKFLKDAEQAYKDDPEKAADDEDFYGGDKDA